MKMGSFCEVVKRLLAFIVIVTLIGTVFVLLVNRKQDGVFINKNVKNYWDRITKRSIHQLSEAEILQDSCILPNPSKNDLLLLRGGNLKHMGDIETNMNVFCTLRFTCESDNVRVLTECSSRSCSSISVTFKETNITKWRLNMHMLAEILEVMNDLGVGEINEKLLLSCEDSPEQETPINSKLKLEVEYLGNRYCTETYPQVDINVLFFRFLSRRSLTVKMTSLMETIANDKDIDVIDFTKYQSTEWKFNQSLSLLLQGSETFNASKLSLLTIADRLGFDVKLLDTSTERGFLHEEFIKLIAKELKDSCHKSFTDDSYAFDEKCCSNFFDEDFDIKTKLDYLKDCFVTRDTRRNEKLQFRIALINYIDYSTEDVLIDKLLSEIISLLSKQNSITIFLSDVGDPTFATFASSLFLQTEPSNPFLFFFIPRSVRNLIPKERMRTMERNKGQLISLPDVHETIKYVIYLISPSSHNKISTLRGELSYGIGRSLFMARGGSMSCGSLKITPPGLCICEEQSALYPNDTLQIAFAETAIGLINNRLLDYVTTHFGSSVTHLSPLIRGKWFSKVRVRNHHGAQQRVMNISYFDNSDSVSTLFNISMTFDPAVKTCTVGVEDRQIDNTFIETHFSTVIRHISRLYAPRQLSTSSNTYRLSRHFGVPPREINLHQNCLVILKFDFKDSATIEVTNVCSDRKYNFRFDSNLLDSVSLIALPISVCLKPGDVYFLTSLVKSSYLLNHGLFHYETDFDVVYL